MIWKLEVANALVVAERRRKIRAAKSTKFLEELQRLAITVDLEGLAQVFTEVLDQARRYQRSAYDATYLELAKRRRLPFATRDKPLSMAAEELGLAIFQPA